MISSFELSSRQLGSTQMVIKMMSGKRNDLSLSSPCFQKMKSWEGFKNRTLTASTSAHIILTVKFPRIPYLIINAVENIGTVDQIRLTLSFSTFELY